MPKVSFITGVKNRAAALEEMLQSLIKQDLSDWEAIIVDDHSTEDTQSVVKKIADSRISYYQLPQDKTGICHARNLAISHATAEILLTADGDDFSRPQRAQRTLEIMTKENADAFYSNLEFFESGTDKRWTRLFQPYDAELFQMFNFMTNPGTAFRKDMFEKAGGFDPEFELSEDYDLYLRMFNLGAKFAYTEEILVEYRRDAGSASIKNFGRMHEFIMKTRIKNNIKPFNIEDVRKYALADLAENILSEGGRKVWRDDRFKI